MKRWKLFLVIGLALLILILVLQNTAPVEMKLLFATVAMPRALWLLIAVLLGFVLGLALAGRVSRSEKSARASRTSTMAAPGAERPVKGQRGSA